MDRNQKAAFVSDLHTRVAKADAMVVAHYRGLTVKQLTALRREMQKAGGEVQVSKNRLAKLAFKDTAFDALADLMVGPTVLFFGTDGITASKVTQAFADKNEPLVILGGLMDGKKLTAADVKTLSKLPTMDEIRGKLVGLIQAPAAQLARVTNAYATKEAA